jgi:hypothetical protein
VTPCYKRSMPRAAFLLALAGRAAIPPDRQPARPPAMLSLSRVFARPGPCEHGESVRRVVSSNRACPRDCGNWRSSIRQDTEFEGFWAGCPAGHRAGAS